jgi:hypothetical protein
MQAVDGRPADHALPPVPPVGEAQPEHVLPVLTRRSLGDRLSTAAISAVEAVTPSVIALPVRRPFDVNFGAPLTARRQ